MTTQTILWDADEARRRNVQHAVSDSASLSADFLIANPRLKLDLSYRKESLLKISNRERIAIFHLRGAAPRITEFLSANPRLEFPVNRRKQTIGIESNRKFFAISPRFSKLTLVTTSHPSLATGLPWPPRRLIETPRLKIPPTLAISATSDFLIETKTRFLCPPWRMPFSNRRGPQWPHRSRPASPSNCVIMALHSTPLIPKVTNADADQS
jgi:hypothetical protein